MKFDIQSLMQQAQKMQDEMERTKRELSGKFVSAESGGGMVRVKISGSNELVELKISKEIVNPDDIEMLEDLVLAAVNIGLKKAQGLINEETGKVANMLPNIPGMNFNL